MVGGGVRDLLLGHEPKDFDIATDASPEEVKRLFRNSRLIGRRFRLAHVRFGREIIEVATFRATDSESGDSDRVLEDESGRILRDNVYGSIDDDVWRRDFTCNGLYYNIADYSIWDYVGGVEDVRNGVLRLIGDPVTRYREDPVRMLRAVRFAARLGFRIHKDTEAPLSELAPTLADVPPARLFDETTKLFLAGYALPTFELMQRHDLYRHLFPASAEALADPGAGAFRAMVTDGLGNTDERIDDGKPVTPMFLFAVLLWEPIRRGAEVLVAEGMREPQALQIACDQVCREQQSYVSIPKRITLPMRDVLCLQPRFMRQKGGHVFKLMSHPRFRAAYDFLLLRAAVGEVDQAIADWWTEIQTLPDDQRARMAGVGGKPRRKRRRRGRRRSRPGPAPD